eukprot:2867724-Rhodomonas_salina.2
MTTDDVSVRQGRCWPESSEKPVLQLSSTTTVSLVSPDATIRCVSTRRCGARSQTGGGTSHLL